MKRRDLLRQDDARPKEEFARKNIGKTVLANFSLMALSLSAGLLLMETYIRNSFPQFLASRTISNELIEEFDLKVRERNSIKGK